jgi:hypothetical protein
MHKEILTGSQSKLLPLVKQFAKDFYLVGGTAIALHLGHRQSIDFDLFQYKTFNNLSIQRKILKFSEIDKILVSRQNELTLLISGVKMTFFEYPFKIDCAVRFETIKLPDLLTLAAMKAYALGMRAKWKDYADLYFIIKDHYTTTQIAGRAKEIFEDKFSQKIFLTQLAYFKDINYSEKIDYLPGFEVDDEIIKKQLIEFSLQI